MNKNVIKYPLIIIVVVAVVYMVVSLLSGSREDELYLYCGAGLRPVIDEVVAKFTEETGMSVRVDYNASNLLLGRIRVSGAGDLFIPGDEYYIQEAAKHGLIRDSWTVAAFVPVILVAAENPKNIRTLTDLTRNGLKLGLADERTAAIGRISRMIFKRNDIPIETVEKNLIYDSVTVHELATAVELGHIDAAIVWEPVATRYADLKIVRIPKERNVVAPVPVAVLESTRREKPARQFVAFILSEQSMSLFEKHHYGKWDNYHE